MIYAIKTPVANLKKMLPEGQEPKRNFENNNNNQGGGSIWKWLLPLLFNCCRIFPLETV
jgi:hypothetical protein